jgi:signal transduction histidine kinase
MQPALNLFRSLVIVLAILGIYVLNRLGDPILKIELDEFLVWISATILLSTIIYAHRKGREDKRIADVHAYWNDRRRRLLRNIIHERQNNTQVRRTAALSEKLVRATGAIEYTPVDIHDLFEDIEADIEMYPRVVGRVTFEGIPAERELTTCIDYELMKSAIENLIDNACKYSTGNVKVVVINKAGHLSINVVDHGKGIHRDKLELVFEEFVRLAEHRGLEGSGLGLSLVKAVVEGHKGEVKLDSTVDVGTKATLKFPINLACLEP